MSVEHEMDRGQRKNSINFGVTVEKWFCFGSNLLSYIESQNLRLSEETICLGKCFNLLQYC